VARIGVQGLLVGLGALLLTVAGVVFLATAGAAGDPDVAFSWDRLPLATRALAIAAITALAMAAASWLRPRLAETAEAVGTFAVALVLADAWSVRETRLFGTDRLIARRTRRSPRGGLRGHPARLGASVGCGRVGGRVRGGTCHGAVGRAVAGGTRQAGSAAILVGLVSASALGVTRLWMPAPWRAELVVLRVVGGLGLGLAALLTPGLWGFGFEGSATVVITLAAFVAASQAAADRGAGATVVAGWSAATGALAALAAIPASTGLLELVGLDRLWTIALAPATSTAIALAALHLAGRTRALRMLQRRATVLAARTTAWAVSVPAAVTSTVVLLHAGRVRPVPALAGAVERPAVRRAAGRGRRGRVAYRIGVDDHRGGVRVDRVRRPAGAGRPEALDGRSGGGRGSGGDHRAAVAPGCRSSPWWHCW
jgi:hypothetical protein